MAEHRAETPLYWRLLRLRAVHPSGWQRAVLVEGSLTVGVVLALSGAASSWVVLAMPLGAALAVKANDVIAAMLPPRAGSGRRA